MVLLTKKARGLGAMQLTLVVMDTNWLGQTKGSAVQMARGAVIYLLAKKVKLIFELYNES